MRSSKSRSRSKANRPRSLGNIINRVFDSSGPEGKVRGTPQQIIEKYLILARDAQLSNDRVAAENFLQHAEHYTRLLGEAQRELAAEQEARQQQYQQNGQNRDGNRDRGDRRDGADYRDPRPEIPRGDYAPAAMPGPVASAADVIDLSGDDDAGLVETPEASGARHAAEAPAAPAAPVAEAPAPAAPPRPERAERATRPERSAKADPTAAPAESAAPASQDAAERAPRRPRGPRKPKADTPAEAKPAAAE